MPALDPNVFEDEAQQLLAFGEVERAQRGEGPLGEVLDPLREPVVLAQLRVLAGERLAFTPQAVAADLELASATGELSLVDHAGLVEIGQTATLSFGLLQPAVHACELCGEEIAGGTNRDRCAVG